MEKEMISLIKGLEEPINREILRLLYATPEKISEELKKYITFSEGNKKLAAKFVKDGGFDYRTIHYIINDTGFSSVYDLSDVSSAISRLSELPKKMKLPPLLLSSNKKVGKKWVTIYKMNPKFSDLIAECKDDDLL